jgi:hypothetical protein
MSLVARIVIWLGFAAQPETARAATQLIAASVLDASFISPYGR